MKQRTRILIYILIGFAVAIIGAVVVVANNKSSPSVSVEETVDLGKYYLLELSYDKAVLKFTEAIEIDHMNTDAYLGLAEAYVGLDDTGNAIEVLASGYNKTGDSRLKNMLDALVSPETDITNAATSGTTTMITTSAIEDDLSKTADDIASTITEAIITTSEGLDNYALAYSSGIDDRAGLYTKSEIEALEKKQSEVSAITGWNIAVVTTNIGFGEDGSQAVDFAERYYDDIFGSNSSSVVFLIDIDYRHISMDGDVLNYFNTSRLDTMLDACESEYMNFDDVGNLEQFYYYLEYYYNEGTVPYDSNIGPKNN